MKVLKILVVFFTPFLNTAQSLNDYKYILVENQYEFQDIANEYRLNEQVVFELKKRNFKAYRNTEALPSDMNQGACNTLQLKVKVKKGLQTVMNIEFIDCSNNLVYGPITGTSRLKNFEKDYRAALRKAIGSLNDHNYVDDERIGNSRILPNSELPDKNIPVMSETPGDASNSEYKTADKIYTLKQDGSDFMVLKEGSIIGSLKISSSGCYLAITTDFIGIGFQENESIKIEFEKQGTQILEFKKN